MAVMKILYCVYICKFELRNSLQDVVYKKAFIIELDYKQSKMTTVYIIGNDLEKIVSQKCRYFIQPNFQNCMYNKE